MTSHPRSKKEKEKKRRWGERKEEKPPRGFKVDQKWLPQPVCA